MVESVRTKILQQTKDFEMILDRTEVFVSEMRKRQQLMTVNRSVCLGNWKIRSYHAFCCWSLLVTAPVSNSKYFAQKLKTFWFLLSDTQQYFHPYKEATPENSGVSRHRSHPNRGGPFCESATLPEQFTPTAVTSKLHVQTRSATGDPKNS